MKWMLAWMLVSRELKMALARNQSAALSAGE